MDIFCVGFIVCYWIILFFDRSVFERYEIIGLSLVTGLLLMTLAEICHLSFVASVLKLHLCGSNFLLS